jgi:hypothetical protein
VTSKPTSTSTICSSRVTEDSTQMSDVRRSRNVGIKILFSKDLQKFNQLPRSIQASRSHHKVSCRRSLSPLRYNSICSRMSFFFNIPTNCPFCVTRRYRMPRARNISMTLSSGVFSVICPHNTTPTSPLQAGLGTSTCDTADVLTTAHASKEGGSSKQTP